MKCSRCEQTKPKTSIAPRYWDRSTKVCLACTSAAATASAASRQKCTQVCAACGSSLPLTAFSKNQLKIASNAKCHSCTSGASQTSGKKRRKDSKACLTGGHTLPATLPVVADIMPQELADLSLAADATSASALPPKRRRGRPRLTDAPRDAAGHALEPNKLEIDRARQRLSRWRAQCCYKGCWRGEAFWIHMATMEMIFQAWRGCRGASTAHAEYITSVIRALICYSWVSNPSG